MRLFSISAAANRSGLSPHVIRIWERRYKAVEPLRSEGNRRLYSEQDITRLSILKKLTLTGQSIAQLATLPTVELNSFLLAESSQKNSLTSLVKPNEHQEIITQCLEAIQKLNHVALNDILKENRINLGQIALLEKIIVPVMQKVGEEWSEGNTRIYEEHMASVIIRTHLGQILNDMQPQGAAQNAITAAPIGQEHELGALSAGIIAASQGWRVLHLGANLPPEEIAGVIKATEANLLMLSLTSTSIIPRTREGINEIINLLPDNINIFLGGRLLPEITNNLKLRKEIKLINDLTSLRYSLSELSSLT